MERPVRRDSATDRWTEMTVVEIREDLLAGTESAPAASKAPPLSDAEVDDPVDIFAKRGQVQRRGHGRRGLAELRRLGQPRRGLPRRRSSTATRATVAPTAELFAIDDSYKAIKTTPSFEAQAMKTAELPIAPTQTARCRTWAATHAGRPRAELVGSHAARQDRRGARRAGRRPSTTPSPTVFVAQGMWEAGTDGMDFDTPGPPVTATSSRPGT